MSLDLVKEHVKTKRISKLYFFYGPEDYLINYYITAIEKLVTDENTADFNRLVLSGKVDGDKILTFTQTYPVFATRKFLVIKETGLFKTGSKSDELEAFIGDIPEYMCVIFAEGEVDKRQKLYRAVAKAGIVAEFPWQRPQDLIRWVRNLVRVRNKEISPADAAYLVDINDQGMTGIYNEVNKILSFVQDRDRITLDDIKKVGSVTIKSVIFNLTDALVKRDLESSFRILDDILSLREPVPRVLVMIAWQFRQIYLLKLFTDSGESINDAGKRLKIHPYTLSKIRGVLPLYTVKQLEDGLISVYECDRMIKTGKMKDRIALEVLLENLVHL